jgi:hypothetical protein
LFITFLFEFSTPLKSPQGDIPFKNLHKNPSPPAFRLSESVPSAFQNFKPETKNQMKTIIFTLCSNNYLAHAKTLGDSIHKFAPEAEFSIGLVDEFHPEIDYSFFNPFEIIKYDQIGFSCFTTMLANYNIIEFNTAVKPYFLDYFLQKHGVGTNVYYIDPDIVFYKGLDELQAILKTHNIVLTPMITKANLKVSTDELVALRHGMYNLGFIGVKYSEETLRFVNWWKERLREHCIIDKPRGLFVDQKWIDIAPLFFDGVFIFKHLGYNMAWWNIAERELHRDSIGNYFVNTPDQELVFFHFSGYKLGGNSYTGRIDDSAYSFQSRPDLVEIFNAYSKDMLANDYHKLTALKPLLHFGSAKKQEKISNIRKVKILVRKSIKAIKIKFF